MQRGCVIAFLLPLAKGGFLLDEGGHNLIQSHVHCAINAVCVKDPGFAGHYTVETRGLRRCSTFSLSSPSHSVIGFAECLSCS
jgi:hypothetical protein